VLLLDLIEVCNNIQWFYSFKKIDEALNRFIKKYNIKSYLEYYLNHLCVIVVKIYNLKGSL
jgi:hypothetical protein